MTEEPINIADSAVDSVPLGRKRTFNETAKGLLPRFRESSYVTGIELVIDGGMTRI